MIEKVRQWRRLPATAWSPSFSLFLVLVPVQVLVLLYLQAARRLGSGVEFLSYSGSSSSGPLGVPFRAAWGSSS